MGDTRISVSLILGGSKKSTVTALPTDSPLCEVVHRIKTSILADIHHFLFSSEKICTKRSDAELSLSIYDCSLHPPKDMTSIVNQYNSPTGPNSITLQTLNWFPSAKLVIFSSEDEEARKAVLSSSINTDEDFQYNLPSAKSTTTGIHSTKSVKLSSEIIAKSYNAKLLPSEIFQAVAESRFDAQENVTFASISHHLSKVESKPTKRRTEEERRRRLDARLKIIDDNSKQSKTSAQVKRMLIKSRAEGDKKVRVEDRFYLETVVMDDSNDSVDHFSEQDSTHRFYGRSNNIGRIVSSATKNFNLGSDRMAELLVIDKNGEDGPCCSFRRLPNTTPIYEAERGGQLNSFDRVIIRVHNILEETSNADGAKILGGAKDEINSENYTDNVGISSEEGSNTIQRSLFTNIAHAIEKLENDNRKKRKAVLNEKVRHILLKGKAKGNKKIPETQRFYLEVVHLNKQFDATIYPVFLSVYDPIHLISKYVSQTNYNSFTLLIEGTTSDKNCIGETTYSIISTEKRCIDLKDEGLLAPFKRIILVINE